MTGQNLIDSLTTPTTEPDETPAQKAVREGISLRAGVNRLLSLCAAKSINRNLEAEDEAFATFCNGRGKGKQAQPKPANDDMNITSAGNVTITYQTPEDGPSGSQPASVALPPKAGAGWFSKTLVAASLLAGGSGVGYIINDLLKPTPAAATDNDTDTITELDFPK